MNQSLFGPDRSQVVDVLQTKQYVRPSTNKFGNIEYVGLNMVSRSPRHKT